MELNFFNSSHGLRMPNYRGKIRMQKKLWLSEIPGSFFFYEVSIWQGAYFAGFDSAVNMSFLIYSP